MDQGGSIPTQFEWRCSTWTWKRAARLVYAPFTLQHLGLPLFPIVTLPSVWGTPPATMYVAVLALALIAMLQTVFTDPGGVPTAWHRRVGEAATPAYSVCPHTGTYRPPRAHYDAITQRQVLNLDHACPWVVSTIGFGNRKFFIQFLVYTTLASILVLVALGPGAAIVIDDVSDSSRTSINAVSLFALWCVATHGLLIGPLVLFTAVHIGMVMCNQTSIEDGTQSTPFDLGRWINTETVMGRRWFFWWIPLWCGGPHGDGVHWAGFHGHVYGRPIPSEGTTGGRLAFSGDGRPLLPLDI